MPKLIINYGPSTENSKKPNYDRFFKEDDIGFRTNNSGYFKSIMNYVSSITEHINLRLCKDGIRFMSLDNAHVALVNCFIPLSFFRVFNLNKENEIVLGINLVQLMKILHHINHNDELVVKFKGDSINIIFVNKKYQKYYSLKLILLDTDERVIHALQSPTNISLDSKYFNDIITDFSDIGETISIKIRKENEFNEFVSFICSGDMTELSMILCNQDIIISNLQDLAIEFNLKNLQIFSKGFNLNKDMTIEIVEQNPIKLSYSLMKDGYIDYYIAPKMEDDDDEE